MEVRCGSCNKLFRIADEKISGTGIKFACSQCRGSVTITREEYEQYAQSKAVEPVTPPAPSEPRKMEVRCGSCGKSFRISEDKITGSGIKFACSKCGAPVTISKEDLDNHKRTLQKSVPPVANSAKSPAPPAAPATAPAVVPALGDAERPMPALPQPREQAKAAIKPTPEQTRPVRPAAVSASSPAATSSTSRQLMVLAIAVLIIAAVGYSALSHFKASTPVSKAPVGMLTSIDGLEVINTTAAYDAQGDYVISGDIVNTTDVERPAWLIVAEMFDRQGILLGRARMLNGIELYTHRDYEILAKRGTNIQELKARNLQEQRSKLLPKGTVHFEITILEAPLDGVKFNANLQPFDPVQLFNEVVAEQKQP